MEAPRWFQTSQNLWEIPLSLYMDMPSISAPSQQPTLHFLFGVKGNQKVGQRHKILPTGAPANHVSERR